MYCQNRYNFWSLCLPKYSHTLHSGNYFLDARPFGTSVKNGWKDSRKYMYLCSKRHISRCVRNFQRFLFEGNNGRVSLSEGTRLSYTTVLFLGFVICCYSFKLWSLRIAEKEGVKEGYIRKRSNGGEWMRKRRRQEKVKKEAGPMLPSSSPQGEKG